MKPWTAMLGLGAACAACCAIPLLGIAGGLVAFASTLWATLWACADEFIPVATALDVVAIALAGWWFWRGRRALHSACGCATTCATGAEHAKT